MTLKRKREVIAILEKKGLVLVNFGTTRGGGHYEATIQAPNGATRRFPVAKTPGDHRADENMVSQMRNWCAQNPVHSEPSALSSPKEKAAEFKVVRSLLPAPRAGAKKKAVELRALAKSTLFSKAELAAL